MDNVTAINMLKMRNLGLSIPDDVYEFVINSLEELEQYRAIGSVDYINEAILLTEADKTLLKGYKKTIQEYKAIGTAGECREAMEVQKKKKPNLVTPCKSVNYYQCPVCRELVSINENFCNNCGQALYWED